MWGRTFSMSQTMVGSSVCSHSLHELACCLPSFTSRPKGLSHTLKLILALSCSASKTSRASPSLSLCVLVICSSTPPFPTGTLNLASLTLLLPLAYVPWSVTLIFHLTHSALFLLSPFFVVTSALVNLPWLNLHLPNYSMPAPEQLDMAREAPSHLTLNL